MVLGVLSRVSGWRIGHSAAVLAALVSSHGSSHTLYCLIGFCSALRRSGSQLYSSVSSHFRGSSLNIPVIGILRNIWVLFRNRQCQSVIPVMPNGYPNLVWCHCPLAEQSHDLLCAISRQQWWVLFVNLCADELESSSHASSGVEQFFLCSLSPGRIC